ncbi:MULTISPECIES: DUF6894 family protein [Methylobacterium]|uniref:DUF6894 family protein n=1 Tax=Methylobacterium TaxID=407 RepID=UPI001047F88B|nr:MULTISPECIES: hypothetical protein [Methylobacterium]MDR7035823.1 hypothetical protein [Methylobacterium sp. BE186]
MPCYHFHLRTPEGLEWDAEGVPFDTLEEAYLDVWRGIETIAADLLRGGTSRAALLRHAFEIADTRGRFLMEVPFAEVLGLGGPARRPPPLSVRKANTEVARTRRLIVSVCQERDALYATLSETHALLARLRALDIGSHGPRRA